MRYDHPLYQNQGIHTVNAIFTVEKGILKVLLVKRSNEPFKDMWALVSGALYNNETFEEGTAREIAEKTGLKNVVTQKFEVYSALDRSPVMRMLAIANICVISSTYQEFVKDTRNTHEASWFDVKEVPQLAFDHTQILQDAVFYLKEQIYKTDIVKALLPTEFTIPNLQAVYEAVLCTTFDRRNFSKKMLSLGLLKDLNKQEEISGKKPAKLYSFKNSMKIKDYIA